MSVGAEAGRRIVRVQRTKYEVLPGNPSRHRQTDKPTLQVLRVDPLVLAHARPLPIQLGDVPLLVAAPAKELAAVADGEHRGIAAHACQPLQALHQPRAGTESLRVRRDGE